MTEHVHMCNNGDCDPVCIFDPTPQWQHDYEEAVAQQEHVVAIEAAQPMEYAYDVVISRARGMAVGHHSQCRADGFCCNPGAVVKRITPCSKRRITALLRQWRAPAFKVAVRVAAVGKWTDVELDETGRLPR